MKKIGIIGSESFLARNFIKYYRNQEDQITLYDYVEQSANPQLKYVQVDFSCREEMEKIDFDADVLMIFMGCTGTVNGFEQYQRFIEVNEVYLLNILSAYNAHHSKALLIYPSSRLIFKSNEDAAISEDGERELKSVYAVTKNAAEQYLKIYRDVFGVQYVILRICTPIGSLLHEKGSYGTFEIFREQAVNHHKITLFGDGKQRKTFTDIRDVCKALELLVSKAYATYCEYNLGGQALSLLEIAQAIAKDYQVPIDFAPWPEINQKVDGGSVVFDSKRFDTEFGMRYVNVIEELACKESNGETVRTDRIRKDS